MTEEPERLDPALVRLCVVVVIGSVAPLLDTTMVGTPFTEGFAPLPADWPARIADLAGDGRVVLGTDFPNIPYPYAEQLRAIAGWAAADDRLGDAFLRSVLHDAPARLLSAPR